MNLLEVLNNNKYRDICVFVILYMVVLGITGRYAIYEQVIIADQSREYLVYLEAINSAGWHYINDNTLNACLMVTYLPAQIQKVTGWDAELLFKFFPCIFYSLLPPFIYLIARKYMGVGYALLASGLVLCNFFFLYSPSIGRVGVALGFMAGLIWGLLNRNYYTAGVFAALVVFSHYGTAYITTGILSAVVLWLVVRRRWDKEFRVALVALVVVSLTVFIWYHTIAITPGDYAKGFTVKSFESAMTAIPESDLEVIHKESFYSLSSREEVIQVAFGKTWDTMNIPQKIEFGLSWMIVILVSWGLVYVIKRRKLMEIHRVMVVASYLLILLSMAIPYISNYYGMGRVWLTSLVIMVPPFVLGIKALAGRYAKFSYIIILSILIPYGMCVSGAMHLLFGISK